MTLNDFKSWKLLYEDEQLCFSSAVTIIDQTPVFLITFFNPENISKATKHLIQSHLHNYVGLIDDEGKLHLILHQQSGRELKKFINKAKIDYDDRIQVVYEILKMIEKYDVFNNAIKIQLVDEDQILITDDGLAFRELIDYTASDLYSDFELFKQLGKTIDFILYDSEGYHSQFIDNIILGHHSYGSFKSLRKDFKDVFIFEKPEALESINAEYHIIINDLEAGPPLPYNHIAPTSTKAEIPVPETITHEDLQSELANLLKNMGAGDHETTAVSESDPVKTPDGIDFGASIDEPVQNFNASNQDTDESNQDINASNQDFVESNHNNDETIENVEVPIQNTIEQPQDVEEFSQNAGESTQKDENTKQNDSVQAQSIVEQVPAVEDEGAINLSETIMQEENATKSELDYLNETRTTDTQSFKDLFKDELSLPETLPKSSKQREFDDEEALEDRLLDELFESQNDDFDKPPSKFKVMYVIIPIVILVVIGLIYFGSTLLFKHEPIEASFEIEPLHDNRVAFMNQSTGGKDIVAYEWEIYYAGSLISTFDDKNLFPVFESDGTYTIQLSVQGKDGEWSVPYTVDYTTKGSSSSSITDPTEAP